ncbi:MAG: acylneuraminate cytidylyltransferase family protein [Candidatus Yanofskybacteria bacterium]|nr:acylneuraminate cytidylyltransferase family protein [Candidatus Yanofskybacteria bacterium]
MKIFAIIPARSGSRGVPLKNIKLLGGFPLLAYSIAASKLTENIQRVIVSTDSPKIADIAKKYGAEIPFIRPAELAQDFSTDFDVLYHAVQWLKKNEGDAPDILAYLRPTTPFRDPVVIAQAIQTLIDHPRATSLRTLNKLAEPPQKLVKLTPDNLLEGFFPDDPRVEYFNLPRQNFPQAYSPNGIADVVKSEILKDEQVFGPNILGMPTEHITEVDHPEDFDYLEYQVQKNPGILFKYLSANFKKED